MEQNMIAVTPEYISPQELSHRLKSMAILNIVMSRKEEAWLRFVRKLPSEEESYNINNGGGDEMDIFFEENGVFIRGFDHENELSPFAADEWEEAAFSAIYEGVPQNFLDRYEDEEERECVTFCMWYDYEAKCWKQNIVEGNDGGKDYLLGFICEDAEAWADWAAYYYEQEINMEVVKKVYAGGVLTEEDIHRLNPGCNAQAALQEIAEL